MTKGLRAGLEAEHKAIFVYGQAGSHLSGERLKAVHDAEMTHRDSRDAALEQLGDADDVPPPQASYSGTSEISDAASAEAAVTDVEAETAAAWRAAVYDTAKDERRVAVQALSDAAITLGRWNRIIDAEPSTTAFPGRP